MFFLIETKANATEMFAADQGATEGRIISLFKKALEACPCILFIDEVRATCWRLLTSEATGTD